MTTTALNYAFGQSTTPINKNTQFNVQSSENIVTVTVTPGHPVTVEFNCNQDWKYRTTTGDSTTDKTITAGTPFRLRFEQTTTFYHLRVSADGVNVATPILQE